MRRLIMIGGGGDPAPPAPFEHFPLSTASQIVVDGNSISANHGAIATLAEVISERLGTARAGTLIESTAISGQTWANMLANHADVDALWNPDKTFHALVINETTNSIRLGATVEQTKQDIRDYIAAVTAAHPWVVIAWPALPVGHADETTYPGEVVKNQGIIEVNNWMRDNATDIGIHHWLDVRSQYPQFDHDGSAAGPFTAYQAGWQEIPPSTPWNMFGWLHPTVGAWGAGSTPPTGKRAIATTIGDAFLNHTIRAFA